MKTLCTNLIYRLCSPYQYLLILMFAIIQVAQTFLGFTAVLGVTVGGTRTDPTRLEDWPWIVSDIECCASESISCGYDRHEHNNYIYRIFCMHIMHFIYHGFITVYGCLKWKILCLYLLEFLVCWLHYSCVIVITTYTATDKGLWQVCIVRIYNKIHIWYFSGVVQSWKLVSSVSCPYLYSKQEQIVAYTATEISSGCCVHVQYFYCVLINNRNRH